MAFTANKLRRICTGVQLTGIVKMGVKGRLSKVLAITLTITVPAQAQTGNGIGTQFELAFWQSVTGSDDPALYEAYLEQYPAGTFSGLARAKLANLRKGAAPIAPPVTAPISVPVPVPVPVRLAPVQTAVVALPQPTPVLERASAAALQVAQPPAPIIPAAQALVETVKPRPKIQPVRNNLMSNSDDSALLEALAKSQELGAGTMLVAATQGFSVPPRPLMGEVPELTLPPAFCSAEQRNSFHETRYKPVMDITRVNNEAAVAHMQRLQQLYDSLQLARDSNPMNAVAVEARSYQQEVAAPVYNRQLEMVQKFSAIMAVPISTCQMATAK